MELYVRLSIKRIGNQDVPHFDFTSNIRRDSTTTSSTLSTGDNFACNTHTRIHRKTHWQLAHAPVLNPHPLLPLPLPLHCFSFVSGIQNRPKNKYLSICLRGEHMKGLSGRTGRQGEGHRECRWKMRSSESRGRQSVN